VLADTGTETGWPPAPRLYGEPEDVPLIDSASLRDLLSRNEATVLDLSLSANYQKAHIPGAWFAIRTRLDRALSKIPVHGSLVFTSEDGELAQLGAAESEALVKVPIRCLKGGNAAWRAARYELSSNPRMADDAIDQWRKPYDRSGDVTAAMNEYLAWEIDLLPRIARDGTLNFDRHCFTAPLPAESR
jgi:hypothetical protein